MPAPLPHTKQVDKWAEKYLSDGESLLIARLNEKRGVPAFREIYWNSLSVGAVVAALSSARWKPSSGSSRFLTTRIPLLIALGQISVAKIELRRFVELAFWTIYFTDHPVEWRSFVSNPGEGFAQQQEQPIKYCAHRSVKFYLDYARELFDDEPSKLAVEAIRKIREISKLLNAIVHPAQMSVTPTNFMVFEDDSASALRDFGELQKEIFGNVLLCFAALFRSKFDRMPPVTRGHFERLVGQATAKSIRSGPFGLS